MKAAVRGQQLNRPRSMEGARNGSKRQSDKSIDASVAVSIVCVESNNTDSLL